MLHEFSSRRALLPFLRLQRLARPTTRPALRAFDEGQRFREERIALSDVERRAWVLDRVRHVVRRAGKETPYYRELFAHVGFDPATDFSFADFARLPVLDRSDVALAGAKILATTVAANQLRKDMTGGSTGTPTQVWLGPEERGWRESGLEFPMRRLGVPPGSRTALFWGHNLDPVIRSTWRERYHDFETNVRWFDCFRLSPAVLDNYHKEFEQWQPTAIVAYASALGNLAEHLLERGCKPNYPTACMVTGAEKLWPRHREMIEKVFSAPVHERYGSRDVGLMAFQYEPLQSLDFEVDWSNVLLEPETDEPNSAILVTKLHADAMPMIRYRIGDMARFPAGSRPGHPTLQLHEILGRETGRIWLPDGRWIHGNQFPHLLKDFPVREFMLTQRSDYSVQIEIVAGGGFNETNQRAIHSTVSNNLPGLDIQVTVVDKIARTKANKWQPVVSEVERANGAKLS